MRHLGSTETGEQNADLQVTGSEPKATVPHWLDWLFASTALADHCKGW